MISIEPMKSMLGCLPCCHPDRPISPPAGRGRTPVRSNRESAFKCLIQMALSKVTQANFSAESIFQPVFPLLQGSEIFGRPPGRGVRRLYAGRYDRRYRRCARAATRRNGGRWRSSTQFGWAAICSSVGPHSSTWEIEKPSRMSMLM